MSLEGKSLCIVESPLMAKRFADYAQQVFKAGTVGTYENIPTLDELTYYQAAVIHLVQGLGAIPSAIATIEQAHYQRLPMVVAVSLGFFRQEDKNAKQFLENLGIPTLVKNSTPNYVKVMLNKLNEIA